MSDSISALPAPPVAPLPQAATKPLRLWPAVLILAVQWAVNLGAARLAPGTVIHFYGSFLGPVIGAGLFLLWWLFASRAAWRDRLLVLLFTIVAGAASVFIDPAEPHVGMFKLFIFGIPTATLAWCVWLLATPWLSWPHRRTGLFVLIALAFGFFALLRLDGVTGDMSAELHWRWLPTTEQQFLATRATLKPATAPAPDKVVPLTLQAGDWPEFRGPQRDGRLRGVKIATDWDKKPPQQLWRHKVGPGWSSFAVIGDHIFTQEQWDQQEAVVCYQAETGAEIWHHLDDARFAEAVGGNGPRATPTFHDGKLYTLGARGKLNCLDATTGKALWSRDAAADTGAKLPPWGFASSPLVCAGLVSVYAGGPDGKSVQAYDAATGVPAWAAGRGEHAYSSPQRATLAGEEQILVVTEQGLTGFHPTTGAILWNNEWDTKVQRVVQPALLDGDDVLLGSAMGFGTRRVHVAKDGSTWHTSEVWTTKAISPYYNDLVIHQGHLYGFDGNFLTCVNLQDGKRRWKERGYGNGQVLLLADQDLLLVLAENGEVALVAAQSERLNELARFQALEGKTWNHPVVAHGRLFVRNSVEMACYQLKERKD
jgi:outer membrane protein assembly factor BamB